MSKPIQKTALLAWFLWILAIVCETASIVLRIHIDTLLLRNVQGPEYLQEHLYWVVLVPALVPAYATVGIPVAIGIAMLRHQLYDIDLIIHRTLVYSTLTVLLAAVYEVSVITLQSFTGGLGLIRGNQLAIVASTFLIGALFKPVRGRTQKLIDRRFYRRKYDAAKTLATFNTTIRDEVDLNQLCTKLMAVVEETMQPAHVSLWLCPHKRYIEETTRALPFIESVGNP